MPLVQTRGAASAQGFGEFAQSGAVNYIEDVFSSYLWTGTGAALTITNGIDLSTKGGLVWIKARTVPAGLGNHSLFDTVRGATNYLQTNSTTADQTSANSLTAFNTSGFSLGSDSISTQVNVSPSTYASWTFREQPKFFDVVTYTGTGTTQNIPHSLGSVPGFIITKNLASGSWWCFHRSLGNATAIRLNSTAASNADANIWDSTTPTSTQFTVGASASSNNLGATFVAYIYAHDAGGFGLAGTDNVISCGSFTTDGAGDATVNLGYEPQWLMVKASSTTGNCQVIDNMRGFSKTGYEVLNANSAGAASAQTSPYYDPSATGFSTTGIYAPGVTVIYIAIRRGPMKVPTLGTSVFSPVSQNGGSMSVVTAGFPVDLVFLTQRSGGYGYGTLDVDRLRGSDTGNVKYLKTQTTSAETQVYSGVGFDSNTSIIDQLTYGQFGTTSAVAYWNFRRAPGFFDEVCYTGNGGNMTISHNLGVVPTLMIVRGRDATGAGQWKVYDVFDGNDNYMALNTTAATASGYGAYWNTTTPTSTVFYVGSNNTTNTGTYVAYLFATCPGVSKVGSYTGNGTTQTIDCGFGAGGARFVVIKRTNSTGDWYVYDTARGMTVLTDPYLLLNDTAGETATLGSVTTVSTGFALNSTILAAINVNAGTYIFFAVS